MISDIDISRGNVLLNDGILKIAKNSDIIFILTFIHFGSTFHPEKSISDSLRYQAINTQLRLPFGDTNIVD